jgi:hypothetical protein
LDGFGEIGMKKNNINAVDSATVCQGDLNKCASRRDIDKPYWLEENTVRIIISILLRNLFLIKMGLAQAMKLFPPADGSMAVVRLFTTAGNVT